MKKKIDEDEVINQLQEWWDAQDRTLSAVPSLTFEELECMCHTVDTPSTIARSVCRQARYHVSLATVLAAIPMAVVLAVVACLLLPPPDGYIMNLIVGRMSLVADINQLLLFS